MGTQENLNKFKIGECRNVGNCTHIGERQAIPSDIANSGGFKCKYCGAQLQEEKKPKSFWEKYGKAVMIAVAAIVIVVVILLVVKTCNSGDNTTSVPPEINVTDPDTATKKTGAPTTSVKDNKKKSTDDARPVDEPKPKPVSKPKVSFGKYEGPADGLGGTITVTKPYALDLHDDGEPLQLSPGDEIQQTKFTNGELRGGVWVHSGSRRSFTR